MKMSSSLAAVLLLCAVLPAYAQIAPGGGVQQQGVVIANDCAAWVQNGVIKDAGAACGGGSTALAPGTTTISPSTPGGILFDNAGVLGDSTTLPTGLVIPSATITGSTLNGLTVTTTTGVLTITSGKTATFSNSLTLAGTDGSTLNVGAGGTLGTAAFQNTGTSGATLPFLNGNNTFSGTNAFAAVTATSGAFGGATLGGNTVAITGPVAVGGNITLTTASGFIGPFFETLSNSTNNGYFLGSANDLMLGRIAANSFGMCGPDVAAPAACTLQFPGVAIGTSNTAGPNTTINLPVGTGTGAGGTLTIASAPASTTGSTPNTRTQTMKFGPSGLFFTGAAPTPTGTGTPTMTTGSTDSAGAVTAGLTATSVVITFATAKTNAPFCLVQPQTQLAAFSYTVSTTAITITQTLTSSDIIDYACWQH